MTPEILGILSAIVVPGLVWLWVKFGKPLFEKANKIELIKVVFEGLEDGELTKDEAQRIIEEVKKLVLPDDE